MLKTFCCKKSTREESLGPTPGEILQDQFLTPLGISAYRLSKEIGVPQMRISEILSGKRAITVDTGLRLARYFGTDEDFFTRMQLDFDATLAKAELSEALDQIQPIRPAQQP